jgi:glyoxylase-like metal-dependent hydrolase (beta-lactamase superfamily II)
MTLPAGWWMRGLLALAGLGGLAAVWLWSRTPDPAAPPPVHSLRLSDPINALPQRPAAVAPGVYLLGKLSPAAAYVVDTSDGLVLVDSGLEARTTAVTEQLAELGLDAGRLRTILLTHVHADHSLGAESLRELTGARVYAGRGDCQPLREGGPREAFFSDSYMPALTPHPTPVDIELAGGESIELGDTRFEVIATPGHTPGSVCYLLERSGLRVLFTGDVIQHLTLNGGSLGTYVAYLPPLYRGDARAYLGSLRRLRALPAPDLILPGHPRMDADGQSPRLSAAAWHGLLDAGITEMETLIARYDADGANFLDGHPKELLPGLHYLGDCGGSPVYALRSGDDLLLFDAPGGADLPAFLAHRFKELGWGERKPTAILLTSAGPEATAGLEVLVRQAGCRVVVGSGGLGPIRALCPGSPEVLTEQSLPHRGWPHVRAIPLGGRGTAALAYEVHWAGKTVLVSGRIPVKPGLPESEQLMHEVNGSDGGAARYVQSLARLGQIKPDLWLTALPVHGQNANIYDREWEEVLERNRMLFPTVNTPPRSTPQEGR